MVKNGALATHKSHTTRRDAAPCVSPLFAIRFNVQAGGSTLALHFALRSLHALKDMCTHAPKRALPPLSPPAPTCSRAKDSLSSTRDTVPISLPRVHTEIHSEMECLRPLGVAPVVAPPCYILVHAQLPMRSALRSASDHTLSDPCPWVRGCTLLASSSKPWQRG